MPAVDLVVSDLDGTFWHTDDHLPDGVLDAVAELVDHAGHLATGDVGQVGQGEGTASRSAADGRVDHVHAGRGHVDPDLTGTRSGIGDLLEGDAVDAVCGQQVERRRKGGTSSFVAAGSGHGRNRSGIRRSGGVTHGISS